MKNIQNTRDRIDEVDDQLIRLLKKRTKLVQKIGKYKKLSSLPVKDGNREKKVLKNISQKARLYKLSAGFARKIWRVIFEYSYKVER